MGLKNPYVAVTLIQTIYAGMNLLSKAAFNGGMNSYVFVFYRQLAGTLCLVPLALIFERKNAESSLSFATFCKIFMISFLGITLALNAYSVALSYTSATLGAAATNCIPVATFVLAVALRMETLRIKTTPGIMKIAGFVVCLGGVATLTFYQGPHLKPFYHLHFLGPPHNTQHLQSNTSSGKKWMIGCLLFFVSITAWGSWLVLQAQVLKSYPLKLRITTLQCMSSSIQSFILAIAIERDPNQWKLGWDIRLLTVIYCGTLVTGVTLYLQAWVIEEKGPVFQAMSQPLSLLITIIGSVFLLGEVINLGSVLGGILLVLSLYTVLLGKSKEQAMENHHCLPVYDEKELAETSEQNQTRVI